MTFFYQEASFILILLLISIFFCSLLLFVSYTFSLDAPYAEKVSAYKNIFCVCFYLIIVLFIVIIFYLGAISFSFWCTLLSSLTADIFFGLVASLNNTRILFTSVPKMLFNNILREAKDSYMASSIVMVAGKKMDTTSKDFLCEYIFDNNTQFVRKHFPVETMAILYKAALYKEIQILMENMKKSAERLDVNVIAAILMLILLKENLIESINNSLNKNFLVTKEIKPDRLILHGGVELMFYSREFRKAYIVKEDGVTLKDVFPNEDVVYYYIEFLDSFFPEYPMVIKSYPSIPLYLVPDGGIVGETEAVMVNLEGDRLVKIAKALINRYAPHLL